MSIKIGDDYILYRDTADAWITTPAWSIVTNADDLSLNLPPNAVAVQSRGNKFITYGSGKIDGGVTFGINVDPDDAHFIELLVHLQDGGIMHFAVADGAIATSGTKYWHGDFVIAGDFTQGLNIGDAAKANVELKPSAVIGSSDGALGLVAVTVA